MVAAAALLLGAGGALGISALVNRPDDLERSSAALEEADRQRDVEATRELTATARDIAEEIKPTIEGLAVAIPPQEGAPPGPVASAEEVAAWSESVDGALDAFGDAPSAGTAVNLARGGFLATVEQLQATVSIYAAALDAEGAQQQDLIEIAGQQRRTAVFSWSVAATQLDLANIDAGLGHAHVVLPVTPGSGAFLPDSVPEGTG